MAAKKKPKPDLRPAAAAVATVVIGACVATFNSPAGGPQDGPKVFAKIAKAAKERKLSVMTRSKLVVVEAGEDGLVEFSLRNKRVKMVPLPETYGLYMSEIKKRETQLKRVGRSILRRARDIARSD